MVSPESRRRAVCFLVAQGYARRASCKLVGITPSVSRFRRRVRNPRLRDKILTLAKEHPRYGFRRIHVLLVRSGLSVNLKAVHRLWKLEGLRLSRRVVKRRLGRSTIGTPEATRPGQGWCYDFVHERLENGRAARILVVMDEYSRRCLSLLCAPSIPSSLVAKELSWLFLVHGKPEYIRSDNGTEFIAKAVTQKLEDSGVKAKFIEPGSPWQNGRVESFNDKLRDELLNREIFQSGTELQARLDAFLDDHNNFRPHSSLNNLTPAMWERKFANEHNEQEAILTY